MRQALEDASRLYNLALFSEAPFTEEDLERSRHLLLIVRKLRRRDWM